jgi:MazG family protein
LGKTEDGCQNKGIDDLTQIIRTLRGKDGCPWDQKQTPETMWKCLIEEVYELLEAIEDGDENGVCEETGDVLFQLLFIAELYREKGGFDISQSMTAIAAKMVRRHPHVYAKASLENEGQLWERWEEIKGEEKRCAGKAVATSVLDAIPSGMPPLLRASKVSEKAVRAGFDWAGMDEVLEKVQEELAEFQEALATGNTDEIATEFGDVMFTLTNVARLAKVHPETALARSTDKFEKRYRKMENELACRGLALKDIPRQELELLWDKAKNSI